MYLPVVVFTYLPLTRVLSKFALVQRLSQLLLNDQSLLDQLERGNGNGQITGK